VIVLQVTPGQRREIYGHGKSTVMLIQPHVDLFVAFAFRRILIVHLSR